MGTQSNRTIDPEILDLSSGLFDSLPPPPPLPAPSEAHAGDRAIDPALLCLDGGLFDSLPPPPPFDFIRNSLVPVEAPALPAPSPYPPDLAVETHQPAAWRQHLARGAIGLVAAGLMALGVALAPEGTAQRAHGGAMADLGRVNDMSAALADVSVPPAPESVTPAPALAAPSKKVVQATRAVSAPVPPRAEAVTAPAVAPPPADLGPSPVAPAAARPARGADIDMNAASASVAAAGRRAQSCLAESDVRAVPVIVTFAPSGRVTSARVAGGPLAGTAEGGCVATVLRGAAVGPFEGSAVTVRTTIRVR